MRTLRNACGVRNKESYIRQRSMPTNMQKTYVKLTFGTDILTSSGSGLTRQNKILATLSGNLSKLDYSNANILQRSTSSNGRLLCLSSERNPYNSFDGEYLKAGDNGRLKNGAVADLLLIEGNPLDDLNLLKRLRQQPPCHHERRPDIVGYSEQVIVPAGHGF